MFKKILFVLIGFIVVVLAYAATRPDTFKVTRSTTIKASPEKIQAMVSDFHAWSAWSPWEHLDPKMTRAYSGKDKDLGAIYDWSGNDEVGVGRMEVTEVQPAQKVLIKLDFLKPFEAHNMAEFNFKANGDSTTVEWTMFGPANYLTKVMSVFMPMDAMVGPDFEKGLAKMKAVAEKP